MKGYTKEKAGKRGGRSTLRKHGQRHFSKIAKKRWANYRADKYYV